MKAHKTRYRGVTKTSRFKWGAKYKSIRICSTCDNDKEAALRYDAYVQQHETDFVKKLNFCPECSKFRNPLKLTEYPKECTCEFETIGYADQLPESMFRKRLGTPTRLTAAQPVWLDLDGTFQRLYWRTSRRNLQCFPQCHVEGLHTTHKFCRTSVDVSLHLHDSIPIEMVQVVGQFGKLTAQGECPQGPDRLTMAEFLHFSQGRNTFVSQELAAQRDKRLTTFCSRWQIYPKLWKFEEELRKKRKSTRKAPGRADFYVFLVIVYVWDITTEMYQKRGQSPSTPFEIRSTRTIQRALAKLNKGGVEEI